MALVQYRMTKAERVEANLIFAEERDSEPGIKARRSAWHKALETRCNCKGGTMRDLSLSGSFYAEPRTEKKAPDVSA